MRTARLLAGCSPPLIAALLLAGVLAGPVWGQAVTISGSLSNFDAMQVSAPVADDFELDFFGQIAAGDFNNYFPGWGTPPRFDTINPASGLTGAEVMWLDRSNPIIAGSTVHFGLNLNPALPPTYVKAAWTKVVKVAQIPVPFQWWWNGMAGAMVDVLTLSPTYTGPVVIQRDYAVSMTALPLEALQYDTTPVIWAPFDHFTLLPGDVNYDLQIPVQPGAAAYLASM